MSSSATGVKRKNFINNDINTNSPPLKKQKLSNSNLNNNRNYCFSSLICIDIQINDEYNNYFTLSISNDKKVFSVGYSDYNSHGHENKKIFPIKQIEELTNIKQIDCNHHNTIYLDYNGDIFSIGRNDELESEFINKDKNKPKTHIPQKINIPSPCQQISCGYNFTILLTEYNKLYSFGNNYSGQLGLGNYTNYTSPQLIPDLDNIEYIVCGVSHSICKTYNNEYYSWGSNAQGQLGQGISESCNKPIQCLYWPDNIIDIKCGYDNTLLLTSEGQIYSFGDNCHGQTGINDTTIYSINTPSLIKDIPEIQRIQCGYDHSMCIDINNNLWLFGFNHSGQLGLGDRKNRYKPILHPTLSNIIDISSGGYHSFVKTIDNKIYAFGLNNHSQLGIETSESNQLTPIQVFVDNEDIWCSTIGKSKQKSARK